MSNDTEFIEMSKGWYRLVAVIIVLLVVTHVIQLEVPPALVSLILKIVY